jgi:hypothetical protein
MKVLLLKLLLLLQVCMDCNPPLVQGCLLLLGPTVLASCC